MTKNPKNNAPNLIIDMSVINYKQWHKMGNPNYEPETGREDMEFSINMYLYILFLVETFQPEELIFAIDSRPNWRDDEYKEYYVENMKIAQKFHIDSDSKLRKMEKEYIAEFDQKTVRYYYSDEAGKWIVKKMVKADVAKIDWEEYKPVKCTDNQLRKILELEPEDKIEDFMEGEIGEVVKQLHRDKKKHVIYKTLKGLTPAYKGNRGSANWDYATPKNGYKDEDGNFIPGFRELSESIAESLAGTFGAKVIKAPLAEADDVIAYYVKNHKSARDVILVSIDSDLHQLFLDSVFFKYWNPNVDEDGKMSHLGGFVDLNKTQVVFNLRKKLLSGDGSDNIAGCGQLDPKGSGLKTTLVGEKTAEKWLTEFKMKEIKHLVDHKSLERNRKLIHLDNIPDNVNANIAQAFKEAKVPEFVEHDSYGASALKILTTRQSAMYRRGDNKEADEMESEIQGQYDSKGELDPEKMTKEELVNHYKRLRQLEINEEWRNNPDRMGK